MNYIANEGFWLINMCPEMDTVFRL